MYVMDCVSWFLGCRVVAWIVICGLMYVTDCVSGFLLCCCMDCDVVCMMYVMDCSSWFLESLLWVLLHGLLSSGSAALLKDGKEIIELIRSFALIHAVYLHKTKPDLV